MTFSCWRTIFMYYVYVVLLIYLCAYVWNEKFNFRCKMTLKGTHMHGTWLKKKLREKNNKTHCNIFYFWEWKAVFLSARVSLISTFGSKYICIMYLYVCIEFKKIHENGHKYVYMHYYHYCWKRPFRFFRPFLFLFLMFGP